MSRQPNSNRVRRIAVAAGLCLAVGGSAVAAASGGASDAPRSAPVAPHASVSSGRLEYRMRALQARGYAQVSCTVNGTRMFNPHTGRSVTITW
jgi:hypothetical protein